MILIVSHKTDFTADFVVNKLNQRGIKYKRLNCEDILASEVNFCANKNFIYQILGENKFDSVWFRRVKLPDICGLTDEDRHYILGEIESFVQNTLSVLEVRWLSFPWSIYRAENKLLQLKTAREVGFSIPSTLVTSSKTNLRSFIKEKGNNIVLKPIRKSRIEYKENEALIFTNELSEVLIDRLDEFDLTPCIYQENVSKEFEVRATVVADKVFAAATYSQEEDETRVDWRRKERKFFSIEIPVEVETLCVELLKRLDLNFGAIDLIKKPDGSYIFLEINPNGQWVWIETQTGLQISEAIIRFLSFDDD